ncbi:hypothetical protein JHK82_052710 [Glycine max]|nr:hypothetical protein JHK82_052710 [Glycine max]
MNITKGSGVWKTLFVGYFKYNVDASVIDVGEKASCGGVMRDGNGHWINEFTRKLGCCSLMIVEIWGLITALEHAWELNLKELWIETDSMVAANFMLHGIHSTHSYSGLLNYMVKL